ncbi:MAG: hypothetical protein ABJH85_10690 [Paracoccaceae bacterium]
MSADFAAPILVFELGFFASTGFGAILSAAAVVPFDGKMGLAAGCSATLATAATDLVIGFFLATGREAGCWLAGANGDTAAEAKITCATLILLAQA